VVQMANALIAERPAEHGRRFGHSLGLQGSQRSFSGRRSRRSRPASPL
jgi:hypothetical protein